MTNSEFHDSTPKRGRQRKPLSATQRALGLLTRREHSQKELKQKLIAKGLDKEEVESVIDRLKGAGWQDDMRFAESLVRSRAARGYGPIYIRAELSMHSIPSDMVTVVFQESEIDWTEQVIDLCERRFTLNRFDEPAYKNKVVGYLIRHGFESEHIRTGMSLAHQKYLDQEA